MSETKTESGSETAESNRELAVIGALFVLVLAIYYQAVGFELITFDDKLYVYDNPAVLSGLNSESIKWAFTAFHSANWHPLTWLSHMLDVTMFGGNAGGHHAVNVFIHLVNSILSFVVFRKLTGRFWPSAAIALLFAVHPAHVESVAWVAERKDVLSTLFMLLAIWAYAAYARDDAPKGTAFLNSKAYIACVVLFAMGLMAKPMLVTLPFVLLLFDYWPLGRFEKLRDLKPLVIERLPMFALTVASSILTVMAQRSGGAVQSLEFLPLEIRLMNAATAYVKYIITLFYPAGLGIWYPYQDVIPVWQVAAAVAVLAGVTYLCYRFRDSHRYLLVGWLIFLGTLVPVIGIVQVGGQSMADRYTYVPYFGLFIMLAFGLDAVFGKAKRTVYIAVFAAAAVVFAAVSFVQTGYWKNSETIYARTLEVTERNFLISNNMCLYLTQLDRLDDAEKHCYDAVAAGPNVAMTHSSLGVLQMKRNQHDKAGQSFARYIELSPNDPIGYYNMAVVHMMSGEPEKAEENLKRAAETNNGSISADAFASELSNLALVYSEKGDHQKASEALMRVATLKPNDPVMRMRLADELIKLERFDDALPNAEYAAVQMPKDANAANVLGKALLAKGDKARAIGEFMRAVELNPDLEEAKANLKAARGEK